MGLVVGQWHSLASRRFFQDYPEPQCLPSPAPVGPEQLHCSCYHAVCVPNSGTSHLGSWLLCALVAAFRHDVYLASHAKNAGVALSSVPRKALQLPQVCISCLL